MSFWEDASGGLKATIVVGGILIVAALIFWVGDFGGTGEPVQQQRGLPAASAQ